VVPADLLRLVRHGEVHNPTHVIYERIPGFGLSELGRRMAFRAAETLDGAPVRRIVASPLQRTQESAAPWSERFGLPIETDERIIEPTNRFAGQRFWPRVLTRPQVWRYLGNPRRPSWGEPYVQVAERMLAAVRDAWDSVDDGEVVLVSHQLPIVMVQRSLTGQRLPHDPRRRRCNLSSITTIRADERATTGFSLVSYEDPSAALLAEAADTGAV
jgi:broad specificity phosphatase PhoE